MNEVYFMISITNREELKDTLAIFEKNGVGVTFVSLGRGTAIINSTPKAVCGAVVTGENWKKVKRALEQEMKIDLPHRGIVFVVPVSAAGSLRQLTLLSGTQEIKTGEESVLKNTKYELIIAIANAGYSDVVMEAARAAGAKGGTVVHAKGTGQTGTEDFLGVTLASEKEMIYIVATTELKKPIMQAIKETCGLGKPAKAVLLSLPVTETAGLRFFEMQESSEEEK